MPCPVSPNYRAIALASLVIVAGTASAQRHGNDVDIDRLLASLTLEQKLGQITLIPIGEPMNLPENQRIGMVDDWRNEARSGAVGCMYGSNSAKYTNHIQRAAFEESEHGIPLIIGNDIIHGYRTIFPIPIASSGTFDLELMEMETRVAAIESRAAGTHWTFAPMIDIARDPRWGRIAEGAGEDPYLGALAAAARVRGFQGESLNRMDTVLATAKHFVAYGAAEGGRDYDTTDMSEQTLRSIYLEPFRAAVLDAGVGCLMNSFNDINGVPATANEFILKDVLREEWGFDGFVVTDYTSINEMVNHGYARDLRHAGVLALNAGSDVDLTGRVYQSQLPAALKAGEISMETIDTSVRRVLEMKKRLGLFQNPYGDESIEAEVTLSPRHRELARTSAARSAVLLKNEGNLLPLDPSKGRIAVIGALADSKQDALGTWGGMGRAADAVSLLEGLKNNAAGATISYARGCDPLNTADTAGIAEAVKLAEQADVVVMVVGEPEIITGEANSRAFLGLPGAQQELVEAVHATGKPMIVVLMHGRPLVIPWISDNAPAILAGWHMGVEHGNGLADVIYGKVNPSAKLTASWPMTEGQIPVYYAYKNTGRPHVPDQRFVRRYNDLPLEPRYAFGYGLSYTTFDVGELRVETPTIGPAGTVRVSATVRNTGKLEGAEVVQCYIRDRVASRVRPVRELRGFERVELKPGESREVTFDLGPRDLGFYDQKVEFVVEPGMFDVWVGTDSNADLHGEFEVVPVSSR